MHLVQEPGQLLKLVDHHPRGGSSAVSDEAFQQAGVGGQPEREIGSQEIDDESPIAELGPHEEALARRRGPEQEEGLSSEEAGQRQ